MEDFDFIDSLAIGNGISKNIADLTEPLDLSLSLAIMGSFQEETRNKILQLQKQFISAKSESEKRIILSDINKLVSKLK